MEERCQCTMCLREVNREDLFEFGDELLCPSCLEEETTVCDRCGDRIWRDDAESDSGHTLCFSCYDRYYTRCSCCGRIIHEDDAYTYGEDYYCETCYHQKLGSINDYGYKPEPIFYGVGNRFLGVELEIDGGGEVDSKAVRLLDIANRLDDHMYCKHDGSLDDGLELVTHPMTLDYHKNDMPWADVLSKAKGLGYVSHQAGTCGLHVHVNRTAFGRTETEREEVIARILYFFEKHWEELLKFSRRTQRQLDRWAARYGLKEHPKDILSEAKGGQRYNRYTCVNLTNPDTIEFRMFRGTLKLNTLIATLQLVDRICDVAVSLSDDELKSMSWTTFVSGCTEPELVQYLKERRLYINEPILSEAEV